MRDGRTRKIERLPRRGDWAEFCERYAAKIVVVAGHEAGAEFDVDRERLIIGRGPGVQVTLNDPAVSRQHAALEFDEGDFRVIDLGSTNGIQVEGKSVQRAELENGRRFEIGGRVMQLVVEERETNPETYEISVES